jgi:phosphatidate phosphatase APP1
MRIVMASRAALLTLLLAFLALAGTRRAAGDEPGLLLPPALGRQDRVWIFGRVLEEGAEKGGPKPVRTARSILASNLEGAEVEARFLGRVGRARSGYDGEFEVILEAAPGEPFPPGRHEVVVTAGRSVARSQVLILAPHAPFLLVSDFDDTVAVTNVTSRVGVLRSTFMQDEETQPVVPGMAGLYRCLTAGGAPLAFVSGSPVQLAPRVERFLRKHRFPPAALHLRNVGPDTLSGYKEPVLERLAARFPELPLVLVGDTGERDPEIYAAFARTHPGRVLRIYLRQATPEPVPAARLDGAVLFTSPIEAARDAAARGLAGGACASR